MSGRFSDGGSVNGFEVAGLPPCQRIKKGPTALWRKSQKQGRQQNHVAAAHGVIGWQLPQLIGAVLPAAPAF
jgi:hypothetical protein